MDSRTSDEPGELGPAQRMVSVVSGGALVVYGLLQGSLKGIALSWESFPASDPPAW